MKKRLEAELISIAHRILKLKNNSETNQLFIETQKLYETLSVLKFYNENFEQLKNKVSVEELEEKIENSNQKETEILENESKTEVEPVFLKEVISEEKIEIEETDTIQEEEIEVQENAISEKEELPSMDFELSESENEEVIEEFNPFEEEEVDGTEKSDLNFDFEPVLEMASETKIEEESTLKSTQISFDGMFDANYVEPIFVKPFEIPEVKTEKTTFIAANENLNEKEIAGKAIVVGLNDRFSFVKNLFDGNDDDFNRVISQLNTLTNIDEANAFLDDIVKLDYNNWEGKDEYADRFLEIVGKRFS